MFNIKNEYYSKNCPSALKSNFTNQNTEFIEIKSVSNYIQNIENIFKDCNLDSNNVFYRGAGLLDLIVVPNVYRNYNTLRNEHNLINESKRRATDIFNYSDKSIDELVAIQHYGGCTRLLDITENPLVALAFALNLGGDGKEDEHDSKLTFLTMFNSEKKQDEDNNCIEEQYSKTVSILSSISKLNYEFRYGHIMIKVKEDLGIASIPFDKRLSLTDILKSSYIVRTKQNNPRIRNQRGAFILANSNEITRVEKTNGTAEELKKHILNNVSLPNGKTGFDFLSGKEKNDKFYNSKFSSLKDNEWGISFKKFFPYDINADKDLLRNIFNIDRLFVKRNNKKIVFYIDPKNKKTLRQSIKSFGLTKAFLYPEAKYILDEINTKIKGE